jgi:hypothetical protein
MATLGDNETRQGTRGRRLAFEDAPMTTCILWLCLSVGVGADTAAKPVVLQLFADAPWYKAAKGEEMIFDGRLELNPGSGRAGAERFNPYQLTWSGADGKPLTRELYLPDKAHLLAAYRGQRLRVLGKAIDTNADGKIYRELWVARLEVVGTGAGDLRDPSGIHARCTWQPDAARRIGAQRLVIRDGQQLARLMGLSGSGAVDETATTQLAQRLRVTSIDWKKSMLVCVAAGLQANGAERLTITRLAIKDRTLTVHYRIVPPAAGAGGFSYPAETILVDRFDGEVRIQVEPPAGK